MYHLRFTHLSLFCLGLHTYLLFFGLRVTINADLKGYSKNILLIKSDLVMFKEKKK